jgi:hypothetical protein
MMPFNVRMRAPRSLGWWIGVRIISWTAAVTIPVILGVACDKKPTAAPQPEAGGPADPAKASEIDPQDAKWIEALQDAKIPKRQHAAGGDRGNVAFLNDDHEVAGLCTNASSINDAFLKEFLARFPKVNRIYLRGTPEVTDEGLAVLGKQVGLRRLIIASPKVTDAGLAHLANLKQLEMLYVRSDKITDQSVDLIAQLSALKELYLLDTQISGDGLQRLKQALPKSDIHADHLTK